MRALWFGRFQPPTIAHFAALRAIYERYEGVTIGVTYNCPRPASANVAWQDVLDDEDVRCYALSKNPFTPEEVMRMWSAPLSIYGMSHVDCVAVPRPQFIDLEARFPQAGYRVVSTGDRPDVLSKMFSRTVDQVTTPFVLHSTEIRKLVKGGQKWIDFLPAGVWQIFTELNGPARLV